MDRDEKNEKLEGWSDTKLLRLRRLQNYNQNLIQYERVPHPYQPKNELLEEDHEDEESEKQFMIKKTNSEMARSSSSSSTNQLSRLISNLNSPIEICGCLMILLMLVMIVLGLLALFGNETE